MGIEIVVRNRDALLVGEYPFQELRDVFSYSAPGARWAPSFAKGYWDGKIRLLKDNCIPTGLFLAMRAEAEQSIGEDFDVSWETQNIRFRPTKGNAGTDRDYQSECVLKMQEASQRGGGLIICATGTGKTRMSGLFFKSLIGRGVFVVDELTLLEQARRELEAVVGEPIGVVGNSQFAPERVTVATVQTLHKHVKSSSFRAWYEGLEVCIIDELHVQLNRRNFKTLAEMRPLVVFGLTATLELQKKHVRMRSYAIAGPVIFRYSLEEGTDAGYLTRGVVVQLRVPVEIPGSNYQLAYQALVNSDTRNNVVEQVVRAGLRAGRHVVVLVEWVRHLEALAGRFQDIKHRKVFGDVTALDRIKAKTQFDAGNVHLLIANKVFQKGVDIKQVDMIVDVCGLKSRNAAVQKFGRGVRMADGKTGLIYIDIADVDNRFEVATKRRARAYKAAGIRVYRVPVRPELNFEKVIARANEELSKNGTDTTTSSPVPDRSRSARSQ